MKQKFGNIIRKGYAGFEQWRAYENSRKLALTIRKQIIEKQGYTIASRKTIRSIREYARSAFGNSDYWPWLAVYTELRGEFVEGWVPDDYYTFHLLPGWNPSHLARFSGYKSYDHRLFGGFAIKPLAVCIKGQFYDSCQIPMSNSGFSALMNKYNSEVVIKRDGAPSGKGIQFKYSSDIKLSDFHTNESYVVQPSVRQHELLKQLHPNSVNSLRITTFLEPDGSVTVRHISLRFGEKGDRTVNHSGLFVYVDHQGNVTSNAYDDIGIDRGEKHPDTGVIYKNLQIPSMAEAIQKCRDAHHLFPYLRFIAWDLYHDETGEPRLIEWNTRRPDMWVNEARIGPLWNGKK